MKGRVLQLSTSRGGVPKLPVSEAELARNGLIGDSWKHPKFHGGPLQAILLVTAEGLEELKLAGFAVYPGALGENITSKGIDRRLLRIGHCLNIGAARVQITKMRVPCAAINVYGRGIGPATFDPEVKSGRHTSPRWGLAGFYAKTVQPGLIRCGDTINLVDSVVLQTNDAPP